MYALYQPLRYALLPHRRRAWRLLGWTALFAVLVDAYLVRRLVPVWNEAEGEQMSCEGMGWNSQKAPSAWACSCNLGR